MGIGETALMAIAASLSLATLLKLGRVSNLPTIWTNVLAGTVLAGGEWRDQRIAVVLLAMSLFYVGGMYLNDYFDRAIDRRERPERPIPAGEVSATTVAAIGFGMLGVGVALLAMAGTVAALAGVLLAAAVVGYDLFHKGFVLSPLVMGLCRALVYVAAAVAATGAVSAAVVIASLALLAYVAGLTYSARQESLDRVGNLWPLVVLSAPLVLALPAFRHGALAVLVYVALIGWTAYAIYLLAKRPFAGAVPRAVGFLIAGISLVDAALLAAAGAILPALVATLGFAATLAFQRYVPGT
jgi:4-hydroxybenzoate polyprenyltransferase